MREEQKNYPHGSFVATTVGFWKNNNLSWDLDHSKGADCIGVLLKERIISRFVNKDGDIDFCESGAFKDACPKCGFHDGDNCEEHS